MIGHRLGLTARQVNLLLEIVVLAAVLSGLVSWMVPLDWARPVTVAHAVSGLLVVAVAPLKIRGPVRSGLRRRRPTRWVSVAFGLLVMAAAVLGLAHATGLWFGVGYGSSLWIHQLFGFLAVPLLIWHVGTRPVRPSAVDLNRRGLLTTAVATAGVVAAVAAQEAVVGIAGLAGARRHGTGSHDTGSFDPATMPAVQWINDSAPSDIAAESWSLTVAGRPVPIPELVAAARPLTARLDCTGGWYADQRWDVVAVGDLLPTGPARPSGRSLRVVSSTGYSRLFPLAAADTVFLAVGYDNRPLRRGHGAPVRLVVPGRRGPWWVKWVTDISISDRPAWAQLPLPPT